MAHKKYTYKNGKRYGPYLYENKRVGNKVFTRYLGPAKEGKNYKINFRFFSYVFLALILLGGIIFIFLNVGEIFNLLLSPFVGEKPFLSIEDINYQRGEIIKGELKLNVKAGELIPSDSKLIINFGDIEKEFVLTELIDKETLDGDFYIEGNNLDGFGNGFGIVGEKEVFPEIEFELMILEAEKNVSEEIPAGGGVGEGEENETIEEKLMNETPKEPVEEQPQVPSGEIPSGEQPPEVPAEETPSGEVVEQPPIEAPPEEQPQKEIIEQPIEGEQPSESQPTESQPSEETSTEPSLSPEENIISGIVTKGNDFVYELSEGKTAKIIEGSIKINDTQLADSNLILRIEDNKVIISTEYSIKEKGFGEEFLGDERVEFLSIDLDELGFVVENDSVLKAKLVYEEQTLAEAEEEIIIEEKIEKNITVPIENQTITNITILENITIENVTQLTAVLGQSVKWVKYVDASDSGNISIELPKSAEKIDVKKVKKEKKGDKEEETEEEEKIEGVIEENITEEKIEGVENQTAEEVINKSFSEEVIEKEEGNVSEEEVALSPPEAGFSDFIEEELEDRKEITVEVSPAEIGKVVIEVIYETPAPYAVEEDTTRGKKVKIIGPKDVHYENVLAFTNLSENLGIINPSSIKIYWVENNSYIYPENVSDTNSNGIYDYVSWTILRLSNQTFEIIVITKAEHLDENRTVISDIYDSMKELDGIWSEEIPDKHYVRVKFEIPLDNKRDITIYPRAASGNPKIEIYEINGTEKIAEFSSLVDNEYNKVYLTSLQNSQDTFDLLVLGGSVEFEHIIDPSASPGNGIDLRPQACGLQKRQPSQNLFENDCNNENYPYLSNATYPSNCGITGDRLSCDDGIVHGSLTDQRDEFAGVNITSFNQTITDCINIEQVFLCYEFWQQQGERAHTCTVGVDANGDASWSDTSITCSVSEPGVTCTDVTASEPWECSNFFGPSGTRALARAQAKRGQGASGNNTWYFDVLFFNVTYSNNTDLTSCRDLNEAGETYKVINNINALGTCFKINADNITLDGQGFNITGNRIGDGVNFTGRLNITIKNLNIYNFSRGIYFDKTNDSFILDNAIRNNSNEGIRLFLLSFNNVIKNNIVSGNQQDGIIIISASKNNTIENNTVNNNNHGIRLSSASGNQLINNRVKSHSSNGIYVLSSNGNTLINNTIELSNFNELSVEASSDNLINGGIINNSNSGQNALFISGSSSRNNTFNNITITNTDTRDYDINFATAGINETYLIDMPHIGNYSFAGAGGIVIFRNSQFGEIRFLQTINGTGTNLTRDVRIRNNSAVVESGINKGLNKSANLTLYGIGNRGFSIPTILRDSSICPSNICYNFTALNATNVIFNVTYWTNYSIGGEIGFEANLDSCDTLGVANTYYRIINNISTQGTCFTITADNITLDGQGFNITGNRIGDGVNVTGRLNITIKNLNIYNFSRGIYFDKTNDSLVFNNTANNNSGFFGYGIHLLFSNNNTIENNTLKSNAIGISVNSFSTNNALVRNILVSNNLLGLGKGISIGGSSGKNIIEENIANLNIEGISISTAGNQLINNTMNSNSVIGIGLTSASNNIISGGIINNSGGNSIRLSQVSTRNNTFNNVTIINTNKSFYDIFVTAGINETYLIDMPHIGNYSFTGAGGIVIFKNSQFGEIRFLQPINGTGTNLTRDVRIFNNSVVVRSDLNIGLNKSANITLYGIGNRGFTKPLLIRDNASCGNICYNFTDLNATNVIFNVTYWTNYSIGGEITSSTPPYVILKKPDNNSLFGLGVFNIILNATVFDINNDAIDVFIYGVNSTDTTNFYNYLLHKQLNVSNGSTITYNFTALPVDKNSAGLRVLYHFDNLSQYQESEAKSYDFSGNNNNGTWFNGPVYNTSREGSKFGYAAQLDGIDDFIERSSALGITNYPFTFSAWVRKNNDSGTKGTIISFGESLSSNIYYGLRINESGQAEIYAAGSGPEGKIGGSADLRGAWHHVAGVFIKNTAKELYVDGKFVESLNTTTNFFTVNRFAVGRKAGPVPLEFFNGTIDEVAVWNRALSADEIVNLYRLKAGKYYWKVNVSDGLLSNESETREFIVESLGLTINFPENKTYRIGLPLVFNVTLDKDGSEVRYSLDNGVNNKTMSSTDSRTYNATNSSIADGTYTFRVYAKDAYGNINETEKVTFVFENTEIDSCRDLDLNDTVYLLKSDVSSSGNCFVIEASNITLDGQGRRISGSGISFGISASDGKRDITIKNVNITNFAYGIRFYRAFGEIGSINSLIFNNSVYNNQIGIDIGDTNNTIIKENLFRNNTNEGVSLFYSHNNTIQKNIIVMNTNGVVFSSSSGNVIEGNTLSNNSQYGINLQSSSSNNQIINNTANSNGQRGMYISSSSNNLFTNNNLNSNGFFGISLDSGASHNVFRGGLVNGSQGDAIRITTSSTFNNTFNNITITNTDTGDYDINFATASINETYLIDMPHIGNYSFAGAGGIVIFKNSQFGEIRFLKPINGTGNNLTNHVRISDNLAVVESGINKGLNKTANITLYGIGERGFIGPYILRDEAICQSNVCYNFTALNETNVIFNVSYWTEYEIGYTDDLDSCRTLGVANTYYRIINNISTQGTCFTITADNITLDGQGFNVTGNKSGDGVSATGRTNITIKNLNIGNFSRGIFFTTTSNSLIFNNTLFNNTQYGIRLVSTSNNNRLTNNTISSNSLNGIRIEGSQSNTIYGGIATGSGENSIHLTGNSDNNTLNNIQITNTNSSFYDINFASGAVDLIYLIDMPYIGNYSFNSVDFIIFRNSQFGEIKFFQPITASGNNLTNEVRIGNNSAIVESGINNGLNRSANVTLYGIGERGLFGPLILRDDVKCPSNICYNFTALNETNVIFNVSYWTNYSIGINTVLSSCGALNNPNRYHKVINNINASGTCFTITADNITLDGQGFNVTGNTTGDGVSATGRTNITVKNINIVNFTSGIYFSGTNYSFVLNNSIRNNTDSGIYFISSNNNTIEDNLGSGNVPLTFSSGIYLTTSNGNNIRNNRFNLNKNGITLSSNANNNQIINNTANNNSQYGIYLQSSSSNNIINNLANNNSQYGIYLQSSSNNQIINNTANSNSINGLLMLLSSNNNQIINNTANSNSINGLLISSSSNNLFTNNNLNSNGFFGISLDSGASHNVFRGGLVNGSQGDAISTRDYDINFAIASINETYLIDMPHIGNYSFAGAGGTVIFRNSQFGEIRFLQTINGTGNNLTRDVRILNNSAVVRSDLNIGLNKSANITLYGIGNRGFIGPYILRDSAICPSNICYNFTLLTADIVIFNVTSWTKYEIGFEANLDSCDTLGVANTYYRIINNISTQGTCFTITADNITLDGQGNIINSTGTGDGVNSVSTSNITVKNININNFSRGIFFDRVNNSNVLYSNITNNTQNGFELSNGYGNTIQNNSFDNNFQSGIYLQSGSRNNNLIKNVGTRNNHGIRLFGSSNNNLTENRVIANSIGLLIFSDSDNNRLSSNIANDNGDGIRIDLNSDNNQLLNNTANNNSLGINVRSNSNNNSVENGSLNMNNNTLLINAVTDLLVRGGTINGSRQDAITIKGLGTRNITLDNIKITNTNLSKYDLFFESAGINETYLIDMPHIGNYSFAGAGGTVIVKNSQFGEIRFLQSVNGTGNNLTRDVRILNNSATVRSDLNSGLNKSANITLYGIGERGFVNPTLFRDGIKCPAGICYNFTSLTAENVSLNVTYWTNYSIGDEPCVPPANENWNITANITCENKVIRVARDKNVNVNNGGSLSLVNSSLLMNLTVNGGGNITVFIGGKMNITKGSNITTGQTDKSFEFNFKVGNGIDLNAGFYMSDSFLSEVGLNMQGLEIYVPVNLTNNTFDVRSIVLGGILTDGSIIENNTIVSSRTSISIGRSRNTKILGNKFNSQRSCIGVSIGSDFLIMRENNFICLDGDAMPVASPGMIIERNIFSNVVGGAFHLADVAPSANITDNVILNANTHISTQANFNGNNNIVFLNLTGLNKSRIITDPSSSGSFKVKWYLTINVTDSVSNGEVSGADVRVYNNSGGLVANGLTGANGLTTRFNVTEFSRNGTAFMYETNLTINVSAVGFNNFTGELNLTNNTVYDVKLIKNRAPTEPTPEINSTDGSNRTKQDLHCFDTITDLDKDRLNVTVKWYKNSVQFLVVDYNNSFVNGSFFDAVLGHGNTTKGENWSCAIRLFDGQAYTNFVNSSQLKILNTPPVVTLDSPSNDFTTTDRTPMFNWTASDDDNDVLTFELNLSCYSGCSVDNRYNGTITAISHTFPGDLKYLSDKGFYYNWSVRANDTESLSAWTLERVIKINSFVAITLIRDLVEFGPIDFKAWNDTSDDSPLPFLLENIGNVFVNITGGATSLWQTIANPSQYYQFKIDNNTLANKSFNWFSSRTTYTNMPSNATPIFAIAELNYTDATNTAEIDINITVPPNEGSGVRSSTITFTAELGE
ncbi:right-handed parallel beta-helix repeat-containing protein [Candidatus Pacearchaeota archaeon]|nr:right-handed parallel beta-helix repeat-containing protein [Candidatus Pacearchaeota archaeon]